MGQEAGHRFPAFCRKALVVPFLFGPGPHEGEMFQDRTMVGNAILRISCEAIEGSDAVLPDAGPHLPLRAFGEGDDEVAADVGPAEGQDHSGNFAGHGLVGGVAVDDQDPGPSGKMLERDSGRSGRIDDKNRRVGSQEDPQPPFGVCLAPGGLEHEVTRLVGLGEGGGPAPRNARPVEGLEERGQASQAVGDRSLGQGKAQKTQVPEKP